jgi:hypothetical protein
MTAMTLWRDTTTPAVQADLDALLDLGMGYVERQLAAHGWFSPFAVVITRIGGIDLVTPPMAGEQPDALDVRAAVLARLAGARQHLRAVAVLTDAQPVKDGAAVDAFLEHADGTCLTLQTPYTLTGGGMFRPGTPCAATGVPSIFTNAG